MYKYMYIYISTNHSHFKQISLCHVRFQEQTKSIKESIFFRFYFTDASRAPPAHFEHDRLHGRAEPFLAGLRADLSQLVAEHMEQRDEGLESPTSRVVNKQSREKYLGDIARENLDNVPEDMQAWMVKHAQARALLEINPPHMPDFQQAPPSQCNVLSAVNPASFPQHVQDQPSILQHWQPDWLPEILQDDNHLKVETDVCKRPATMAEETMTFRDHVDQSFGWKSKVLDDQQQSYRAAAQATLLPLGAAYMISALDCFFLSLVANALTYSFAIRGSFTPPVPTQVAGCQPG